MFEPPFLTCVFARCLCSCVPFDWLGCRFLRNSPAVVPDPLVFPSDQPAPKYIHTGRSSLFSPGNCSFRFPHVNPPFFSHLPGVEPEFPVPERGGGCGGAVPRRGAGPVAHGQGVESKSRRSKQCIPAAHPFVSSPLDLLACWWDRECG